MFESVHVQFQLLAQAEIVPGGLLDGITTCYYAKRDKQIPTKYPYIAMEWNGVNGITFSGGARKRIITIDRNQIMLALFARGKNNLDEADQALERMIWNERSSDDAGHYDTGVLPFLDRLSQTGIRTPNGDGWQVVPGSDLIVNTIEGSGAVPFCVGAAILVGFRSAGEVRTPAPMPIVTP